MNIEYVHGYWVPANDIHLEEWKKGKKFTQNAGLNKFIEYIERKDLHFKNILDVGAWCGTWSRLMEPYADQIVAFEPDKTHFECLQRNCTIKNIDLIKIDVEGYEMEVLKGADECLQQCTYVMIELNNNSKKYGSSNGQITKYLNQKGFSQLIRTWPDVIFVNNYPL